MPFALQKAFFCPCGSPAPPKAPLCPRCRQQQANSQHRFAGLRQTESTSLEVSSLEQRNDRWVIPDLYGKHGRLCSIRVPGWVKHAVEVWSEAAGLTEGRLLRRMNRRDQVSGTSLSPNAILSLVSSYGAKLGVKLQAHDTRRTCTKVCHSTGCDLEQIQLLLNHASIQTTERYLGNRQNLADSPNDKLGLTANGR